MSELAKEVAYASPKPQQTDNEKYAMRCWMLRLGFIGEEFETAMATRGKKPTPTAIKELEGNPGKRPLNEQEPKPERKAPPCPKWLEPEAKRMVEMTQALLKRSKIMAATKRLVNYSNVGFYQVLSAEVGTKHGLNVSGLVLDELHAQPNRSLVDVLTKGSGDARTQPLYFLITTAGTDRKAYADKRNGWIKLSYTERI